MIRILQVVGTMDLGGIETFLMNIYRTIDRTKLQFDFLCHNRIEAKYTEEIKSLGGKMYCVQGISHVGLINYEHSLFSFFRYHTEYNVVHSHQNELNGIILMQAKRAGIEHRYSHSHTVYPGTKVSYRLRLAASRVLINMYCTRAFACSRPAGEQLYLGKLRDSFIVIPNGINTQRFQFDENNRLLIRKQLNLIDEPVIGHVGRFSKVKNHSFILDCFREFKNLYSNAKLILIGTGELENSIKEKAERLGIKNSIYFVGARTDVNKYLSAMDLFLFPSINEGLPVSVVEAQANGLRVLTSDSISHDTVLTDLIVRKSLQSTSGEWASELSSMYHKKNHIDRTVYAQIVADKGFDAMRIADELCKVYQNDSTNIKSKRIIPGRENIR